MVKTLLSIILLSSIVSIGNISAQNIKCKASEINAALLQNNQELMEKVEWGNKLWSQYVNSKHRQTLKAIVTPGEDTLYEIPVVVHSFSPGTTIATDTVYNKTDAQIQAWLDTCNAIFRGTYHAIRSSSSGGSAVIPVKLVLAQTDKNCNATTGIIRYDGSVYSGYKENGVKNYIETDDVPGVRDTFLASVAWDPQRYYNIFLVNKIEGMYKRQNEIALNQKRNCTKFRF